MFEGLRAARREAPPGVDMAPLIDVVFILLIFFLVTASFRRDEAIPLDRPVATQADEVPTEALRVHVSAEGRILLGARELSEAELAERVRRFVERDAAARVVVIPDAALPSGRLVAVMDAARAGGARQLSVATRRPGS